MSVSSDTFYFPPSYTMVSLFLKKEWGMEALHLAHLSTEELVREDTNQGGGFVRFREKGF